MASLITCFAITPVTGASVTESQSTHSISAQQEQQIANQINQAFTSLVGATKNLDIEGYASHFDTDKFVGLAADGSNFNTFEQLRGLVSGGFDAVSSVKPLEFVNLKISVIDQYTAILVNEFEQTLVLADDEEITVAGGGTQVWSQRTGKWLLVSVSASKKSR